jgi:hypothetical protein
MTVTYGFYNSVGGDRLYDARQLSKFLEGLVIDGVIQTIGNKLFTVQNSGMNISVQSGKAWFNNTWTENDGNITLTVTNSHPTLNRIDSVVLEVDTSSGVRANTIKMVDGTAGSSPVRPTLTDTSTKFYHRLADIYVGAGVTQILTANITVLVGTVDCPYLVVFASGVNETMLSFTDITTQNASVSKHGLMPKLSGNSFDAFRGDGTFGSAGAVPVTNKSGGSLAANDVVIWDKTNSTAVKTTTLFGDSRAAGVVLIGGADNATIYLVPYGTLATVNVQGNVSIGQALVCSTTVKRAAANGGATQPGLIGYAMTAYAGGGAGTVTAIVTPSFSRFGANISIANVQSGSAGTGTDIVAISAFSVSGTNRLLICTIEGDSTGGTVTNVKYGGVALTIAGQIGVGAADFAGIAYLLAPNVGSANITVSGGGSGTIRVTAYCLTEVNQSTPVRTINTVSGTSTTPGASGTATPGDFGVGCYVSRNTSNAPNSRGNSAQVQVDLVTNFNGMATVVSDKIPEATGNSVPFSWVVPNSANWAAAALAVVPL